MAKAFIDTVALFPFIACLLTIKFQGIPAILLFRLAVFGKGYCICTITILIPHSVSQTTLMTLRFQIKPARVELNDVMMSAQVYADGFYVRNISQRRGHGADEVALGMLIFFCPSSSPNLISVLVSSVYKYL